MKNVFYFIWNVFLVFEIFKILSFLDHVGKRLDKKAKGYFKIYDVTDSTANNFNTHNAQYLKK